MRVHLFAAQLARDAEDVGRVALGSRRVAGRRRAIEQIHVEGTVVNAFAQHVHDAAPGDLALQAVQELGAVGAALLQGELLDHRGLCDLQKVQQLGEIDGVVAVVVECAP